MAENTTAGLEREVTGEQVVVEWEGLTLELPSTPDDWDPDTLEAFETGKAMTAIRSLLGSTSYDEARKTWAKANGSKMTVGDLGRLMEAVAEAYGFDAAGE